MAGSDSEIDISVSAQNALKLKHTLARQDYLLVRLCLALELRLAQRQAMAVRGNRTQRFAIGLEQKSVQVVANVLLCHRKVRLVDQTSKVALGQCQRLLCIDFFDHRKLRSRQRRQRETRPSGL